MTVGGFIGRSVALFAVSALSAFLFNWLMPQGVGFMPAEVSHAQWKPVTLAEARSLFDQGARFLDARSEEDYNKLHVWWAMHYTPAMDDSLREMLKLAMVTHQKIVVYGRETSFWPAAIIAQRLRNMGFQDVYVMDASFQDWVDAGYPTTQQPFTP